MPDFIDVRLRVRKEKLGDLTWELGNSCPYAQVLGMDVLPNGETTVTTTTSAKTKRAPRGDARKGILEYIKDKPNGVARAELRTALPDIHPATFTGTLKRMIDKKLIKQVGDRVVAQPKGAGK